MRVFVINSNKLININLKIFILMFFWTCCMLLIGILKRKNSIWATLPYSKLNSIDYITKITYNRAVIFIKT